MMTISVDRDMLESIVKKAQSRGADQVDVLYGDSVALDSTVRMGQVESMVKSRTSKLGLRIIKNKRQGMGSTSDLSSESIDKMIDTALAMANVLPQDPTCGLADADMVAKEWPSLDLYDTTVPTVDDIIAKMTISEDAALSVKGVTNSSGAHYTWGSGHTKVAMSNGFYGESKATRHSLSVSVLAGKGDDARTDYDYDMRVYMADIKDPVAIGRSAGEKTVKMLGGQKVLPQKVPVIFDPRVADSLVDHLADAINGGAIARDASFLKKHLGKKVFGDGITIVDDPHRDRLLGSRLFDGEGLLPKKRAMVDNGILTSWFLDLATGRKLGLPSTGHAYRGFGSRPYPSPTNMYILPGKKTPDDLMASVSDGLYVTNLMNEGVNLITGDYSRGASGFWIKNGKIDHPVNLVTIAGNLLDMFLTLDVANDLEFKGSLNSPTLLVPSMTVVGV